MDRNLLQRLARFALLALAVAVVATSYVVTEPAKGGLAPTPTDRADARASDPAR